MIADQNFYDIFYIFLSYGFGYGLRPKAEFCQGRTFGYGLRSNTGNLKFIAYATGQGVYSIDNSNISFCFTLDLFVLLCHSNKNFQKRI